MKFRYDKKDDALMIWLSKEPVDFAEQNKGLIVHFSKKNKPILIEILDAYKFLKNTSRAFPANIREQILVA